MSDPLTLQELADSLAASAEMAFQRIQASNTMGGSMYGTGYRDALLDTRATVLAMIANVNRRGEAQPEPGVCPTCGALYGEMDHAPEPCLTEKEMADEDAECAECGRNDVVGQVGSLFYCTRHEAEVTGMVAD